MGGGGRLRDFSDRHPFVPNHEKTWPMFQLRVSVQKLICVMSTVWAPILINDTFLKFLVQLIDMIVSNPERKEYVIQ